MARLTIEDKWWTDPRRSRLIKLLGGEDEADLAAVRLWKLAQLFWGNGKKLVPLDLFEVLEASSKLIEAKLAVVEDGFVYARGSQEYLSWLHDKRQSASEGGKKSAESRRKKSGSAQPKKPKTSKHPRSTAEANSNTLEPSGSGSFSDSDSGSATGSGGGETPPPATRSGKFKTHQDLLAALPLVTKDTWVQLYGLDFVASETAKAFAFYSTDPSSRNWEAKEWASRIGSSIDRQMKFENRVLTKNSKPYRPPVSKGPQ